MLARSALVLGLVPALLAPSSATAQTSEPPLSLTLGAPTPCPSAEELRAEALRLARVGPDFTRKLQAEITVERAGARFALRLRTDFDGVLGERAFEGASCEAVTDAAVLTLALMLNPDVDQGADPRPPEREPQAPPAPPPAPQPPPQASPPSERASERRPRLEGAVAGHVGAQLGILPAAGPEIGAAFGVSLRPITAWLGVSYAPAQDATLPGRQQGGRLWAGSASLLGCWTPFAGATGTLGPCGGVELDRLEGRGTGVTDPETGAIFWTSAILGVSAGARLAGRLHLRASVQGLLPLGAPRVFLDEIGQIHRPEALLGRAQLGVAYDLW